MRLHLLVLAAAATVAVVAGCRPSSDPAAPARTAIDAEQLEPYVCGTITRLHTLGGVYLASQPAAEDFEQARKDGVRTVINQRHEQEIKDFDEHALVTSLGMDYENPAWNGPDELTDDVIDETRRLLRTVERPVLMHCGSANRAGAIWFAYRALDDGLGVDAALAEAKTVGLGSPEYERIVRAYIERRR